MEQQRVTITVSIENIDRLYLKILTSLSCLGHVVNLGNVDVMKGVTKIAVVENATAIWEYDPSREDNRVLGGSLDVIAAMRTLTIKVSLADIGQYLKSHIKIDPSIWPAHRVFPEYPNSLWISRTT
jgi:hypothetical protein